MKKKKIRWIIIVLLVFIFAICGFEVYLHFFFSEENPYDYPNSSMQTNRGSFLIDPETILESLNNGKTGAFNLNLEQVDGELPEVIFKGPINWNSSEHLLIADALNQLVWKDDLNDWQLYEMWFFLECQDNPSGFERSFMTYFKGSIAYDVRDFSIMPRYGYVEWSGGNGYPRPLLGWKKIDLKHLRIDALNALGIAEENGGKDTRLKLNNDCNIRLFLRPEIYTGWQILYSVGTSPEFKITIDPSSGKIIHNK